MRRIFSTLAALVTLTCAALASDPVEPFADTDPAMNAAIAEARATLPKFLDHVLTPGTPTGEDVFVKVGFDTSDETREIIWVYGLQQIGTDRYTGNLSNDPFDIPGKRRGDPVEFTLGDINDWSLTHPNTGKKFGNYTTRVVVTRLDADQRMQVLEMLTISPLPPGW